MAHGMERKNVYSALSLHEDTSAIAHARGSTVLHPTVHLKKVKSTGQKAERVKWTGGMISLGKLAKTLDRASRDCIREGKRNNFPVFAAVADPEEQSGKPIVHGQVLSWEAVDDEAGCLEDEDDLAYEVEPGVDDCDDGETISTDKCGTLSFRSFETLTLNGGRSTLSTKSRLSRFKGDAFGVSSDVRIYNQPECGCSTVLKAGSTETLKVFKSQQNFATGVVRFISYKSCPMKYYCQEHSLINGSPNVWLLVEDKYIRCIVP